MKTILLLALCSIATFRMAELIAFDSGPFHIFKRLRRSMRSRPWLQQLFTCYYCQSFWWAAVNSAWCWKFEMVETSLLPLFIAAVAGLAVVIFRVVPGR